MAAALLLLCCCCPAPSLAVSMLYDEMVWTKSLWQDFKVENPLLSLNPTDEVPAFLGAYPGVDDSTFNSLDGAVFRRRALQHQYVRLARPTGGGYSSVHMDRRHLSVCVPAAGRGMTWRRLTTHSSWHLRPQQHSAPFVMVGAIWSLPLVIGRPP